MRVTVQVLMMTTCMETWIVVDRRTLARHYGQKLRHSALPTLLDVESRPRQSVLSALENATEKCANAYSKGKRSFESLGEVDPTVLQASLTQLFANAAHFRRAFVSESEYPAGLCGRDCKGVRFIDRPHKLTAVHSL